MKKTLTKDEMLSLWSVSRAAEPERLDCTVSRTDGIDYRGILEREMRAWYLRLLDCGREELIAPRNVAEECEEETYCDGRLAVITAPEGVRRVLRVKYSGWPTPIVPDAAEAEVRAHAGNPFCMRPVAARLSPQVILVSAPRGNLTQIISAVDPGEDTYIIDDKALALDEDYGKDN